ncbi:uncharacterized [Tachysurus ichikawai]
MRDKLRGVLNFAGSSAFYFKQFCFWGISVQRRVGNHMSRSCHELVCGHGPNSYLKTRQKKNAKRKRKPARKRGGEKRLDGSWKTHMLLNYYEKALQYVPAVISSFH